MKIEYVEKIELYSHGFFKGSFDSLEEVESYLIEENRRMSEHFGNVWSTDRMNDNKYSIIKSKHLVFS